MSQVGATLATRDVLNYGLLLLGQEKVSVCAILVPYGARVARVAGQPLRLAVRSDCLVSRRSLALATGLLG